MSTIIVSKNLDELSTKAATQFAQIANSAVAKRGQFSVALSGGSTPQALYAKLIKAEIDWSKVYFFFGDERNVPPDNKDSNFRMANENLFEPLKMPPNNVSRWKTELDHPERVVNDYDSEIRDYFLDEVRSPTYAGGFNPLPRFDLIFLGTGTDGHTASLFPHTTALHETTKIVVSNWVPQLNAWRYTLTFPVINNAANVMFLLSGKEKAQMLKSVIEGEYRPDDLPAQSVQPIDGELFWFVDEAAATMLSRN